MEVVSKLHLIKKRAGCKVRTVSEICSSAEFGVQGQESKDEISYRAFFERRAL